MISAFSRGRRRSPVVSGPFRAVLDDIPGLNAVFTTAFTDRYRRDGMVGTHVPNLNPVVWRFAIEDAEAGALVWRDEEGEVVGFNMAHLSGVEGWMGPLALEPSYHGHGIGKQIVMAGTQWLRDSLAEVIGLETMPRTMDNIGFYSSLGFIPGPLTITMTLDSEYAPERVPQLGRMSEDERVDMVARCGLLVRDMMPGYDFTREILLTHALNLGDTLVLMRGAAVDGFALCHTVPLVEGRAREELRVLKLVARTFEDADVLLTQLADYARRCGIRRVALRVQGAYTDLYRRVIERGGRVRWTDLRMTSYEFPEPMPRFGVMLSTWEI